MNKKEKEQLDKNMMNRLEMIILIGTIIEIIEPIIQEAIEEQECIKEQKKAIKLYKKYAMR